MRSPAQCSISPTIPKPVLHGVMCLKKIVSLWLAALLMLTLFSACGGETSASGAGHSFSYTLVGNPDTLDPQLAVNDSAKTVLCNLFEGLLTLDENGSVVNGVAESYTVSDDGLTYSFVLRGDSFWYSAVGEIEGFSEEDAAAVTAMDFVFAFQRMFDPVYQSPYRETFSCIQNASAILRGEQDPSMIGVYAKKDNELEIVLDTPNAWFPYLLTTTAALPCNSDYFYSTKGRYGLDEESVIGNGSFAVTRWLYDPYGKYNVIQLCRNPLNHQNHRVYPVDLSFYIEQTDADAADIFENGSTDCYVSTQNTLLSNSAFHAVGAYSLTLGLVINPDSDFADGQIRHALSSAFDRSAIAHGDDVQPACGILPPAVTLLNKSCRELISDAAYIQYDIDSAKRSYSAGLSARNLTETEEGRILVPAGMMDYTPLYDTILAIEETLDVHLSIEEVSDADYRSRLQNGDYSLALFALTGDDSDAASVFRSLLDAGVIGCKEAEQVRSLLDQAAAVQNLTDCVELYRRAEEAVLSDDCFIPLFYKQRYLICKSGVADVQFNPFTGQVMFSQAKYFD